MQGDEKTANFLVNSNHFHTDNTAVQKVCAVNTYRIERAYR